MIFVALLYLIFAGVVLAGEYQRIGRIKRASLHSFVTLMYAIQLIIPGVVLCTYLGVRPMGSVEGSVFFERVFDDVTAEVCLLVFCLTVIFYVSFRLGYVMIYPSTSKRSSRSGFVIGGEMSFWRWVCVILAGGAAMYALFNSMGAGEFAAQYKNLIRFRAGDPEIPRTALNANLYSLTQSFLLISLFGFGFAYRRRVIGLTFASLFLAGFVLASVSRRALLIPLLSLIFTALIKYRGPAFLRTMAIVLVAIVAVGAGKEFLASYSRGMPEQVEWRDRTTSQQLLVRTAAEAGITIVESWATLMYVDLPVRWGQDHLYSALRRVPDEMIGIQLPIPERIVRITTAAFVDGNEQDIPPGLIGQSWLDFRLAGPIVLGLVFGVAIGLVERALSSLDWRSGLTTILYVVIGFVFSLPLNSGSLDYNFSVDIIALMIMLICIFPRTAGLILPKLRASPGSA